jgi:ribose transport system ATP-binding protein
MGAAVRAPAIEVRGVGKSYRGVTVLRGVDLDIAPGEVHGLVGENGAGKSTLLKILGGAIRADHGTLRFDGEPVSIGRPRDAIAHGVSLISQEGALVPALSVLENVFLARWSQTAGVRRAGADRRRLAELVELTGFRVDPNARVDRLPIGVQQQVEILRSLARGARVLAMDEPTAVLTEHEKENLLRLIRRLADGGTTVLLVSHFLDEVLSVADRVTVLRDGALVTTGEAAALTPRALVRHMVGREIDVLYPDPAPVPEGAPVVLAARGLGRGPVHGVDLEVRAGEILGIAGLVGAGRTELLRAIFGLDAVRSGEIRVKGVSGIHANPRRRIAQGLGFLSEDRKEEGLALMRSIEDNLTYSALGDYARWGWLNLRRRRAEVLRWMKSLRVKAMGPAQAIGNLSGGNQQKVAIARLLHQQADVLLLDEPTRGIDVGSKAEIYRLIGELAAQGKAIVMVSSYLPELFGICDRLAVMTRGVLSEARPIADWTEHSVMEVATGG